MGLREYKQKRHFERTPEPAGKEAAKGGRSFVIQKHRARHLHYDFRLELEGVLKSWAVPKGPSLDPQVKRLAMHVEDHPVDYGSFEGIIPEGEYGGGTVMVWDRGTWEPVGDPHEGYRSGKLKFKLHGEKLRGGWMLIRTGASASRGQYVQPRQWLLFKERDEEARPAAEGDILEEKPLSVVTGRSMDEIATDRDRVWSSKAKADGRSKTPAPRPKPAAAQGPSPQSLLSNLPAARAAKMPERVDVQLATLAKEAPQGDEWLHEIKFDGYRMICRVDKGRVSFVTRNQKDWTERLAVLVNAAKESPVQQAILDGEVVALRGDGMTDFQDLQNAFRDGRADALRYYVFDLLYLDGHDLTKLPLLERKRLLSGVLAPRGLPRRFVLSEHVRGNGPAFLKQACKMHLEGIVCKRGDRPYQPGRGYDWLKVKCVQKDEFVIGGYSEPTGSRTGFGALFVGYHNRAGDLVYAGKVGTGFNNRTLRSLYERLVPLQTETSPFSDFKRASRSIHWVEPKLVAQVAFGEWTRDGLLRHPSFQGLREDKPAREVTREKPVPLAEVVAQPETKSKSGARSSNPSAKNGSSKSKAPPPAGTDGYNASTQQLAGVRLTSPDKVLYPEQGITKLDLANYYRLVADWMLPHVVNRPLAIVRCPEGRQGQCFYQKHPPPGTPAALRRIPIREKNKTEEYVVVDDVAGLIALAQVGCLEIHVWGSQTGALEQPDRLIFDLDPDAEVPWPRVVKSALQVREFLEELGLESFVKTTGGKGLHLVVPLEPRHDWEDAKAFCKRVADLIVAADPRHYTANMAKAARPGKIFVDYLRNARGATAIAAYSTRARPGAPVSAPLSWKELTARVRSDHYTVPNLARRLSSLKGDPWEGISSVRQALTAPMQKLASLART